MSRRWRGASINRGERRSGASVALRAATARSLAPRRTAGALGGRPAVSFGVSGVGLAVARHKSAKRRMLACADGVERRCRRRVLNPPPRDDLVLSRFAYSRTPAHCGVQGRCGHPPASTVFHPSLARHTSSAARAREHGHRGGDARRARGRERPPALLDLPQRAREARRDGLRAPVLRGRAARVDVPLRPLPGVQPQPRRRPDPQALARRVQPARRRRRQVPAPRTRLVRSARSDIARARARSRAIARARSRSRACSLSRSRARVSRRLARRRLTRARARAPPVRRAACRRARSTWQGTFETLDAHSRGA